MENLNGERNNEKTFIPLLLDFATLSSAHSVIVCLSQPLQMKQTILGLTVFVFPLLEYGFQIALAINIRQECRMKLSGQ